MASRIVLIAAPGSNAITGDVLRHFPGDVRWLKPGEAADIAPASAAPIPRAALQGLPIDINIVPEANRRKRLLIADMDSTMIQQECIDELGVVAGVGDHIKGITIRTMRGEIDFAEALRERVGLMAGLDAGLIEHIVNTRLTLMPGGPTLVATMRAHGAFTALVSGGFRQFTQRVAARLGFDTHEANDLIIENNRLAGKVKDPILGKEAKVNALHRLSAKHGGSAADAIAVGDGANDIPMLLEAGLGVALHAKPKVQEAAPLVVNHGDLTALLYLQGYSSAEFTTPAQ
jgi:phosphoserine phosphatase